MIGRYLGAAVIALLIVGWFASAAYGWLHSSSSLNLAGSVKQSARSFQQELEQPREDLLAEARFPAGRIVDAVKSAWSEGPSVGAYPQDVIGQPPAAGAVTRPGGP
jgi:hypothetical protein